MFAGTGMLKFMPFEGSVPASLLILDTCTEAASLALFRGEHLLEEVRLGSRTASANLLGAVRGLLARHACRLDGVNGLGVVNGPGSFTGVRVGLAAAKGLCEANGRPLATVSRLAVLADAARVTVGWAVLGAGREQVYVREVLVSGSGREWMASMAEMASRFQGQVVAVESPALAAELVELGAEVRLTEFSAKDAFRLVRQALEMGGSDLAASDANYVRNEDSIYASAPARAAVGG